MELQKALVRGSPGPGLGTSLNRFTVTTEDADKGRKENKRQKDLSSESILNLHGKGNTNTMGY